jgi:fucose permease
MRGRVMAIHMTALVGFIPFTSLAAGVIVDRVGIRTTFTGAGLVCLAFSLLLLRWGRHIRLREESADERERVDTAVAVGTLIEEEA